MKTQWIVLSLAVLVLSSCAPKIYLIDRHTVMEDEAAGEWPEFDKDIVSKSVQQGPTAFPKTDVNEKKKRLYNVLNGELVTQQKGNPAK